MYSKKYNHNGTKTSSFGTSGRINHDSSIFYDSKLYKDYRILKNSEYIENEIPKDNVDKIYSKSSEKMDNLPQTAFI